MIKKLCRSPQLPSLLPWTFVSSYPFLLYLRKYQFAPILSFKYRQSLKHATFATIGRNWSHHQLQSRLFYKSLSFDWCLPMNFVTCSELKGPPPCKNYTTWINLNVWENICEIFIKYYQLLYWDVLKERFQFPIAVPQEPLEAKLLFCMTRS